MDPATPAWNQILEPRGIVSADMRWRLESATNGHWLIGPNQTSSRRRRPVRLALQIQVRLAADPVPRFP